MSLVAEITLYGNHEIGAGWLARTKAEPGNILGDGEPVAGRPFTVAVWMADNALKETGCKPGKVRIFAAGGERYAEAALGNIPYYGSLEWRDASEFAVTVPAEAIEAASEPEAKTIWNSDGTDGPVLICPPPK